MIFSVIIPLYNKAPYIARALDSVLAQTFKDFELIIIDDGSTDNSYKVAENYFKIHTLHNIPHSSQHNYQLLTQKNAGVSTTRNNGVAISKGEYICFLDADDWWAPTFLEEMHRLIGEYPDAGIYGTSYYLVKNSNKRIAPISLDKGFEKGYIDYIQVYSRFLCMPLTSITVAIKKYIFEEMQGFKSQLKLGEDFDLWIRIALKYKVAFLNKPLAYYNQDIPVKARSTRNFYKPESHMLFNLSYLEPIEKTNVDYKILIDKLRTNGLMQYYLTKEYREQSQKELAKVDWYRQPQSIVRSYCLPIFLLRFQHSFMRCCSCVKQTMIKCKNCL